MKDTIIVYEPADHPDRSRTVILGRAIVNTSGTAVNVTIDGVRHTYPMHRVHEIIWGAES